MPLLRNPDGSVGEVLPRGELLRLLEPSERLDEAFNALRAQMAVATELTEELGDHGRSGIFRAMVALLEFCSSQGIPTASLYPLRLIVGAIVDADSGVTTPAFRPDTVPGRPRIPTYEVSDRAYRCVVVECCIQDRRLAGVRAYKVEGANLAARLIRQKGWDADPSSAQLLRLREEVTSRPKADPIRGEFERMMDSDIARTSPLAYGKSLLEHGWVNKPPAGPKS